MLSTLMLALVISGFGRTSAQEVDDQPTPEPFEEPSPPFEESSPPQEPAATFETGYASFYHPVFHGRRTANGETFDRHGLTAAHKTLPFGTLVRVTNLRNDRRLVVRVNDRGPLIKNRVIDLTPRAARELGFLANGVTWVKLEVLTPEQGFDF
jgi:rare lipoprotein A